MALEIERRLQLKREQANEENHTDASNLAASDIDDTLVKGDVECSPINYDTSAAVESLLDDNAPTIRDDVIDEIDQIFGRMEITEEQTENIVKEKKSNAAQLSLTIDSNFNAFDGDNLSPSFSLHSSPSLGALDDSRNQSLYFTPMSARESVSSTPVTANQFTGTRLVRSNSYTIDKPSPMLLKHMANGVCLGPNSPHRSPMALNGFRKNKNTTPVSILRKSAKPSDTQNVQIKENKMANTATKSVTCARKLVSSIDSYSDNSALASSKSQSLHSTQKPNSSSKQKTSTIKRKQLNPPNPSGVFRNNASMLRSIYETGKSPKANTIIRRSKSPSISSGVNKKPENPSVGNESVLPILPNSGTISARDYGDIFGVIEQQHTAQMKALLQRQQEEQRRMQEEFTRQQEELLKKITNLVSGKSENLVTPNGSTEKPDEVKKSNEKMLIDDANSQAPIIFDSNGNRINRFTPESAKCIRRLYYDDKKLIRDDLNRSFPSSLSTASSGQSDEFTCEEVKAANIIAAYMRGYLTRRLFKTHKVQNIVKTMHDTLLIILDMHYEQDKDQTQADIELKFHMIQQVIYTIRSIFRAIFHSIHFSAN